MKLTDRAKKRLTLAGLGVVCVILVIAIVSQFKTEEPKDVSVQLSSAISDTVNPSTEIPTPSADPIKTPEVNAQPIDSTVTPAQSTDIGDSNGTEQSIQAEFTKPAEPSEEAKIDPCKTPDGEKVITVTPVEHDKVTKPESSTPSPTPKSGDKKDGKIYVPGFGWIEDNGGVVQQNEVGSDGDIDKQVGNMD